MPHRGSNMPTDWVDRLVAKLVDTMIFTSGSLEDLSLSALPSAWTPRSFTQLLVYFERKKNTSLSYESSTLSADDVRHALANYVLLHDAIDKRADIGTKEKFQSIVFKHLDAVIFWYDRVLSFSSYPVDGAIIRLQYTPLLLNVARDCTILSADSVTKPRESYRGGLSALWTPAFIKLFLSKIWHCELPSMLLKVGGKLKRSFPRFPMAFLEELAAKCPIMELMWRIMVLNNSEHAMDVFFATLEENPELAKYLAIGIKGRIRSVEANEEKRAPALVLQRITWLVHIFATLSFLRPHYPALGECLPANCKVLTFVGSVRRAFETLTATHAYHVLVAEYLGTVVSILAVTLLEGGWGVEFHSLISASCSLFNILGRVAGVANVEQKRAWKSTMDTWYAFLLHPEFATELQRTCLRVVPADPPTTPSQIWTAVQTRVEALVADYNAVKSQDLGICDNLSCKFAAAKRTSRTCSGCESVAYCSVECQKEDWEHLHRLECSAAQYDRERREFVYTVKARAFHVYLVTRYLKDLQSKYDYEMLCGITLVLAFRDGEPELMCRSNPPQGGWGIDGVQFNQDYLKRRFDDQTRGFEEQRITGSDNLSVEMVIPIAFGASIYLRATAQWSELDGKWNVFYAVPRVGCNVPSIAKRFDDARRVIQ